MVRNFARGVNLSHWLSQCDLNDKEKLAGACTEDDFRRIADSGADHVRLPVDYKLIENESGGLLDSGMSHVERACKFSRNSGLAILIDLHSAPGMSFATPEINCIWNRRDLQDRFGAIWTGIARCFGDSDLDAIAFELLNEPTANDNSDWNKIASIGHAAVRRESQSRMIFVGSNSWQSPYTFPDLKHFDDPHTVYSFHFYEPFIFTHQKACWVGNLKRLNLEIGYPAIVPNLEREASEMPDESMKTQTLIYSGIKLDFDRMEETLKHALDFKKRHNCELYCSEFGAITLAPQDARVNWFGDAVKLFSEYEIGWAVWDYMGAFGIFHKDGKPKEELDILFP